ncbi:MAG: TIM barrel protein [Candidatus Omnitrophota bacterium]
MIFSLSTSWNSFRHTSGIDLINEIRSIGFDTVELNFALTEDMVDDVRSLRDEGKISVSSLHNICPLPAGIRPEEASPDCYSLASPDEKERALAVRAAKNTIDWAGRLGAGAVVLHTGRVEMKDRTRELASAAGDAVLEKEIREAMAGEREEKKGGYLGNVIKSLEELIPYAKGPGVRLGVENRYYYREIPLFDEFETLFKRFRVGDLFYWHDVGHAQVFENLGILRHEDLLKKFSGRLLGVHLHDIISPISDHHAPGRGEIDFRMIAPYIKSGTIKVIEAHRQASADDIRRSVHYLKEMGIGDGR